MTQTARELVAHAVTHATTSTLPERHSSPAPLVPAATGQIVGDVIVGVDTHKHQHVAVAIDRLGGRLGEFYADVTLEVYADLVTWATAFGQVPRSALKAPARTVSASRGTSAVTLKRSSR